MATLSSPCSARHSRILPGAFGVFICWRSNGTVAGERLCDEDEYYWKDDDSVAEDGALRFREEISWQIFTSGSLRCRLCCFSIDLQECSWPNSSHNCSRSQNRSHNPTDLTSSWIYAIFDSSQRKENKLCLQWVLIYLGWWKRRWPCYAVLIERHFPLSCH